VTARALLEPMLRARRFDEALIRHAELIDGVYHVSIGLEATAGALALARRDGDDTMLNHRNHGALAALGSDPEAMFGEIFGRDGGPAARARGNAPPLRSERRRPLHQRDGRRWCRDRRRNRLRAPTRR